MAPLPRVAVGRAFIVTSSDGAVRMVLWSLPRARRLLLLRLRRSWLPQLRSFAAPATAGTRASVAASFCEASANQVWFHTNSEHCLSAGLLFLTFESPFRRKVSAFTYRRQSGGERAIRWLIALMVPYCDPLAIALTAAARHGDQPPSKPHLVRGTFDICRGDAIEGSQQLRATKRTRYAAAASARATVPEEILDLAVAGQPDHAPRS
jgi:hypothetical protein